MPEFILNDRDTPEFNALDAFSQAYITAMFFTECEGSINDGTFDPENGSQLPDEVGFADLSPDALKRIIADCDDFRNKHADLLAAAYEVQGYDESQAGHDFWLTRNGHGVGFWDRGLGKTGRALTDMCGWKTAFPEVNPYLGEDGKVHF
jgi:hypothetical protein